MKTRSKFPLLDESLFEVIENRNMSLVIGGVTGQTVTYATKSKKAKNDGDDGIKND